MVRERKPNMTYEEAVKAIAARDAEIAVLREVLEGKGGAE